MPVSSSVVQNHHMNKVIGHLNGYFERNKGKSFCSQLDEFQITLSIYGRNECLNFLWEQKSIMG